MFQFLLGVSLLPLLLVVGGSIMLMALLENEKEGWATFTALAGAGALIYVTKTNPLPWLQSHVGVALLGLLGYFLVGVAYMAVRWYFYLLDLRDEALNGARHAETPQVFDHKARITAWMTYWPWSFWWFALSGPIKRIWNFIYRRLAGQLQKIADHVFRNVRVPESVPPKAPGFTRRRYVDD